MIKKLINKIFKTITGYVFVNSKVYFSLKSELIKHKVLGIANNFSTDYTFQNLIISYIKNSQSKEQQDLFVLSVLNKKNGVFVEFGGLDGIQRSNTYMLEKFFNWSGLIIEPSRQYRDSLKNNRSCKIDFRCVSEKTGENVLFNEIKNSGLSTINDYSFNDEHSSKRKKGLLYEVETVSLQDVILENGLPNTIDYISIDTEGSEYDIIKSFDFKKFYVKIITIEHNNDKIKRNNIYEYLTKYGYERVLVNFSGIEDWYISKQILNKTP